MSVTLMPRMGDGGFREWFLFIFLFVYTPTNKYMKRGSVLLLIRAKNENHKEMPNTMIR